jgi:bifunctional enzyme CysN/CysC
MQKRINMIVCGHIDHGKSTFVGKLMSELGLIPQDRLAFLKNNSKDSRIEYSHLIDSLADEKSKGITISLSQMAFKYQDQEYAFLDAPGHFEFMQNMIAGSCKSRHGISHR